MFTSVTKNLQARSSHSTRQAAARPPGLESIAAGVCNIYIYSVLVGDIADEVLQILKGLYRIRMSCNGLQEFARVLPAAGWKDRKRQGTCSTRELRSRLYFRGRCRDPEGC